MTVTGAIIVFSVVWWLCFLAVLPIGVKGQWEDGSTVPGTEEGAPREPMLARKALWATAGAAALTAGAAIAMPLLLAQG